MSAEPRPLSPHIETAIQLLFLFAAASCIVYVLETRPPWVDSSTEVGILVASAIGVSVGMRENRLSIGKRLLLVVIWCVVLGAAVTVRGAYLVYFPRPRMPDEPMNLLRDHPFLNAVLIFPFVCMVFATIGVIIEEITAFTRRWVSWQLNQPADEESDRAPPH